MTPDSPSSPTDRVRDAEFADLPALWQVERLQTVYRLTDDVSRARGLDEIYEAALQGLERALATQRASLLLFDPDDVMRFKAWHGLSDAYRCAVEGHSPWSRDSVDPRPVVVVDVLEDEALLPFGDVFRSEGIRALGFIPLVSRGRLIGKFMVYFDRPHALDEEEIRLAQMIAGHVAFAVERKRDEEKLALYREIFANSSEAIAITGANGEYLEQNAAHRRLQGFEDGELRGRTPAIHLGQERFREVVRILTEDGVYRNDVVSVSKSGEPLDIELSAFTVMDDSGRPACFVGIQRDIRARKRTEEMLQFLAGASAALDRSLEYEETARRLASLTVPRLADWVLLEVLDESDVLRPAAVVHRDPACAETVSRFLEVLAAPARVESQKRVPSAPTRRTRVAEILGHTTAADPRTGPLLHRMGLVSAMAIPLRARGRLLGLMTLVSSRRLYEERDLAHAEDFANRGSMALDNARLYREAQESDRRKEEFLAVLAHELRNPLTPLLTCLELMRTGPDPESLTRWREIMERQVRNLSRLVDDLLDVSRITRGKIELQRQHVDVAVCIDRAIETARPLIQSRSILLEVSVEPGLGLEADPLRLEQVLANLLHNAAKYTPEGGRVRVLGSRHGRMVSIRVEDNGIGIDPELLPRLFDLFMQGSRSSGGLGIGLTLVRTLVELHGGKVRASSAGPGKGSLFEVRLPVGAMIQKAPSSTGRSEGPQTTTPRIALVVDDNVDAATLLGEALRKRGHEVHVAHDGNAAIQLAEQLAPEIVLLDLGMPGRDGYEVATRLRTDLGLTESILIAVTGYGQDHHRARSSEAGFSHHIVKPIDLKQLDQILAAWERDRGARPAVVAVAPV